MALLRCTALFEAQAGAPPTEAGAQTREAPEAELSDYLREADRVLLDLGVRTAFRVLPPNEVDRAVGYGPRSLLLKWRSAKLLEWGVREPEETALLARGGVHRVRPWLLSSIPAKAVRAAARAEERRSAQRETRREAEESEARLDEMLAKLRAAGYNF